MSKIKKAFLIYPPTGMYMRDDRCQAPVKGMTAQPARTPLDLAYMAANLRNRGVDCRIKDYPAQGDDWKSLEDDLRDYMPDMLVISITTPTLEADLATCNLAKRANPDMLIVSKGAHYASKDEEVLRQYGDLDIIIRGESEATVAEVACSENLDNVLGITYRENGSIKKTSDRPYLEELDSLPFPARDLLKNELYLTPDTKEPITLIYTGRGCPYQCIFCAVPIVSGNRIKQRSPKSIVDEIEECVNKHHIRNFFFRADTFTWQEDWVVEICRMIVARGLNIRWGTNSRVNTISQKRLEWMKRAGCWIIGFGVESGNQESLDLMKKKASPQDARNAVSLCKKYSIKTYTLFIIGFPWDSRESVRNTIKFIKELDGDYIDINIAYPIPGTELFEIAKRENLFNEKNMHGYDYSKPIIKTRHLGTKELVALRRRGLLSFYLRPSYIARTLTGVRSPKVLWSYIKAGFALLPSLFNPESNVDDFRKDI